MTFDEWADDLATRFSAFGNLIERSESLQDDFRQTFQSFSIDVLKKATKELMLLDPQPFPSDIFGKLYSRCKSMSFAPQTHGKTFDPHDEPRYKCLDCKDGGTVAIYHYCGYQPIRLGSFDMSKHLRSMIAACHCSAGVFHATEREMITGQHRRTVGGLPRFDKRKMKIITACPGDEQVNELTEFVLNDYKQQKHSGFEAYQ